jgi:hypothetical protein
MFVRDGNLLKRSCISSYHASSLIYTVRDDIYMIQGDSYSRCDKCGTPRNGTRSIQQEF